MNTADQRDLFGAAPLAPYHKRTVGAAREATQAAAERVRPHAESRRLRCLEAIRSAGDEGMTADEIAQHLGWKPTQTRPRVCQLAADGLIVPTGHKRPNMDGNMAAVWRVV